MSFKGEKVYYEIPRSLRGWIKDSFVELVARAASSMMGSCTDDPFEGSIEDQVFMILSQMDEVVRGSPIYRAIDVDNISKTMKELSYGCNRPVRGCGRHWSANIEGADINWDRNEHSEGWFDEEEETKKGWKDGPGIIIIEAVVTDPSAIDFEGTIDEQFQCQFEWREESREENEITIKDDTKLEIKRLGAGTTVGRARRDLGYRMW